MANWKKKCAHGCYRIIRWLVKLCYPKITVEGVENLPQEPCLIVGNHCQMHGPIACELYFPGEHYTWCAGQMMHWKEVPAYAYKDFWSMKPKAIRWFFKILSYMITPISVCVFNNARTIGVYRDARIISTFKNTAAKLAEGGNVVVFPEQDERYNHIINGFQDKFIDVARLYHKRTGSELFFVPMYIAPKMKKIFLGKPIQFSKDAPMDEERARIRNSLMEQITQLATALPRHTVVTYRKTPGVPYPSNIPVQEEIRHERAGR